MKSEPHLMWTQLPKYRKLSSSLFSSTSSSSFWQHSQLKCPRLVSVNVQEAMKTPYYTVSALALLVPGPWSLVLGPSTTKNHPKETTSLNQMQVLLIQPSVRLHLRVNNAKCAEHFCILKHALESATPHCPAPCHSVPPRPHHRTVYAATWNTKRATQNHWASWQHSFSDSGCGLKTTLWLFYSTLKVIFIILFYLYIFAVWEIWNTSNICGEESSAKCLDKLTPNHEKF